MRYEDGAGVRLGSVLHIHYALDSHCEDLTHINSFPRCNTEKQIQARASRHRETG